MKTKRRHIAKNGDVQTEFVQSELLESYDALAREALGECRSSIMMSARFLNAALWRLPFEREPLTRTLSVGGRVVRYDPENVVDRYRADRNELVRDCLHAVLHCVFHHPFDRRHDEFDTWSLACDIAVELCALDLCMDRYACEGDEGRLDAAKRLRALSSNLTAPALYRVLKHGQPGEELYTSFDLNGEDIERLRDLFTRDLHDLWACRPHSFNGSEQRGERSSIPDLQGSKEAKQQEATQESIIAEDDGFGESQGDDVQDAFGVQGESEEGGGMTPFVGGDESSGDENESNSPGNESEDEFSGFEDENEIQSFEDEELLEEWQKVSKQVEAELRMQRKRSTTGEGTLLINLAVANKKAANYEEFLKRFATLAEDLRVSEDEFDYVFYTYGLKRYGNMPLVEPLEYAEAKRVREFVIALDTSGSCSGKLIREFVERTYDILRERTSFGDQMNVHVVQCDKEVRSATKITSLRQLEEYRDSFWVSGGGGTDFKPVFAYVDSLVEAGEFNDLRGLIYFTDGYGSFPTRAPDYDVAFVFVDVEGIEVRVPPWACKVVMTQDEILET